MDKVDIRTFGTRLISMGVKKHPNWSYTLWYPKCTYYQLVPTKANCLAKKPLFWYFYLCCAHAYRPSWIFSGVLIGYVGYPSKNFIWSLYYNHSKGHHLLTYCNQFPQSVPWLYYWFTKGVIGLSPLKKPNFRSFQTCYGRWNLLVSSCPGKPINNRDIRFQNVFPSSGITSTEFPWWFKSGIGQKYRTGKCR